MASAQSSPQVLHEFTQNLLDDLEKGRITTDAAIIACAQYPYLRAMIDDRADELAGVINNEDGFRTILRNTLRAATDAINKELPQFQAERPDGQLSPGDIVARARALRSARTDVVTAVGQRRAIVGHLRESFINQLVKNWIEQTSAVIDKERQQQAVDALKGEVEQGLPVQQILKNMGVSGRDAAAIQREVAPIQQELVAATQKLSGVTAIPRELIARLKTPRPDRFAVIAIQTISSTGLSPADAIARAASLDQMAEALSRPVPKENGVTASGVFFRAFASTPTQKAFAAAADALFGQLSPFVRQEVIKATFSRALEGVLAKTDLLTERLGREFVKSEIFRLIIDGTKKEFARSADGRAQSGRVRGALGDVAGAILLHPIVEPLVGSPREMILSYLELLSVEVRLPRDKRVVFPNRPAATRYARADVLKSAGSHLVQTLPSWQMVYVMLLSFGAPETYTTQGARIGRAVPLDAVGGSLGSLLGRVGGGLSSAVFGLGGGLVGMVFGGGLGALIGGSRRPQRPEGFFDDMPRLLAIFVVVVIVLLFVFPSFFNTKFTSGAARIAALLVNSQSYNTGGPYEEDFPDYGGPFPSATTAIEACPVSNDRITQGHHEGVTHGTSCAYDFGAPFGEEVRAVHAGCVAYANTDDFEDGEYKKGSFGNVVRLVGQEEGGRKFYTIYAHLVRGSSPLKQGQCISAGEIVGKVDTTGYTIPAGKGTHLHVEFEYDNRVKPSREQCSAFFSLPAGCGR